MTATKKPAQRTTKAAKTFEGFTDEERAAMKDHAQELKNAARRGPQASKNDGEGDVLAKIAEMTESDRAMAERIHAIVKAVAPDLAPRTYYGMPAYAKDGKVLCWYQPANKFKTRYGMFSFSDQANIDDGALWPVAYALTELTAEGEARIAALVKQAVS
jgi:uncharacterized protein YdhG (YjbR/CyaY superfamily)